MQRQHHDATPDDLDIAGLGHSVGRSLKGIALATALMGGVSFLVLSPLRTLPVVEPAT